MLKKSVDPDRTPCSGTPDLGLQCLSSSLLWDARLKLVKKASHYIVSIYVKDITFINLRLDDA